MEERLRAEAWRSAPPPWREVSGADPFALARLPGGEHVVGLLRGASAVVVLDAAGREVERRAAPAHPTGLEVTAAGEVLVVGEASPEVARFRWAAGSLEPLESIAVEGVHGLRDLAVAGDRIYALDPHRGRLVRFPRAGASAHAEDLAECRGPVAIDVAPRAEPTLVLNCLLEHSLVLRDGDGREVARIRHDGPFWSMDTAVAPDGALLLAAGGVEDAPLDRSEGFFGSIDSFVFLYRVAGGAPVRLAAVNVGELSLITPKWLDLEVAGSAARIATAGYGSDRLVELTWEDGAGERVRAGAPRVRARRIPPGTTSLAAGIAANPLLDAWVVLGDGEARVRRVQPDAARTLESRIGEVLFFTGLMAPWSTSEGKRSRFTCETCHYEGGIDGRIHWTGRGDVHATTKPLFGLLRNRPYFSRALDETMARMVDNEFRVANRGSGRSAWFALPREEHPWLAAIDGVPEVLSPELLRASLITFLAAHEPAPNPATRGRSRFTALERDGAIRFRERCEGCHAARLLADRPDSRVPFSAWEEQIFADGAIVWGRAGYERTGVEPYVHAEGARVPSLRRIGAKRPYFTNGSAATLDDVLARAAWRETGFRHAGAPPGEGERTLAPAERRALRAFLALL